jgi:hypothetical protein
MAHGLLCFIAGAVLSGGMKGVNALGGREDAVNDVEWNPVFGT